MRKVRVKPEPFTTLLERCNMSLREFALNEGVSQAFLTQILKGDRFVSGKTRNILIEATGLAWDELFEIVP